MGLAHSPNIVSNGLIFCIDAANPKCFGADQTSCTNIVTGGAVTGASGQPNAGAHTPDTANFPEYNSVNGGVFDFAGGRGMNCDEDLGAHTSRTIDMWYYKNTTSQQYFTDARNDGGTWFLSNYISANINHAQNAEYNFGGSPYSSSNTDFINRWQHMVFTSDGTGSKIYIDGTERTMDSSGVTNDNLGVNFRIGTRYTTATEWTGYMGPIKVYSRVLTSDEAYTNFLAHRGRFG